MAIIRAACDMGSGALQRQRGHLLTFAPVFLGIGIGAFFSVGSEPAGAHYAVLLVVAAGGLMLAHRWRHGFGPIFSAMAIVALGFCVAGLRAHTLAGPVLDYRYYGTVEGRVVAIDRSASDRLRLTLDRVRLERVAPQDTPRRVRVSLHGQGDIPLPPPGAHAMLTGHLSGPPSPAEPHGFDFQRHAWFLELGAVGYTRTPALVFAPPEDGLALSVFRLRMTLSEAVQARIPARLGPLPRLSPWGIALRWIRPS